MAAILKVKDGNGNVIPIQAIKGEKGDKGDKGDRGLPGSGGVPDGGTTGQVLTKNSDADGDAGWNTPEPFVINSGEHYNQLFVNKSYAEIKEAYESGKNVMIIWNNKQYPLSSISGEKVEFFVEESITNSDDFTMYNIHTRTLAIYSESEKRPTKDYVNLSVYSTKGCNELLAPKASAVLTTEQTLTTEQQSQALANIGGLSKNQGTANSGKFLGIGADGIVVPTEVGGGSGWKTLFNGTIAPTEAVNSMSADLLESCEGMNEFIVWFYNTKNEAESPGNDNAQIQVGKASYDYGRLGDLTNVNEKIIHMILTDTITYSYVVYGSINALQYNAGGGQGGWASNCRPEYSKVKVSCFSGTYLGTLSLKVYGR